MAPTTVGTNFLTIAEDGLITLLSESTAFQDFVGAADATSARARIYCTDLPEQSPDQDSWDEATWAALFPCAVIGPASAGAMASVYLEAIGGTREYMRAVRFSVRFEQYVAEADNNQEAVRKLMNALLDIVEEISDVAPDSSKFQFTTLNTVDAPYRREWRNVTTAGHVIGWRLDLVEEISQGT